MESIYSRLGRTTFEISDLCKSYGDKVLVKDYTYFFLKDDRIGYIGPNGSGKSTLMKMIAGWVKPDSGTIEIGQTVKLGYFSQENEDMDTSLKVIDYIKNVAEYVKTKDGSISASQMLERFLFDSAMQYTPVAKLSGGEKRRLYLLKVLMEAPNVLLLDEPTRGIDVGAKYEIYQLIIDLANKGKVVLVVSSEMPELLGLCDRILVMSGGRLAGEVDAKNTTQEEIMALAAKYV